MKTFLLEVGAESKKDAVKRVKRMSRNGQLNTYSFSEKEELSDWTQEVQDYANGIINDNEEGFVKAIKELYDLGNPETDDIYDVLYQTFDLVNICHETIDSRFIYTDSESIKDYLECINELYRYEETDSGLWEGDTSAEQIIIAKAFYTMRNALIDEVESKLKERIQEYIDEQEELEDEIEESKKED